MSEVIGQRHTDKIQIDSIVNDSNENGGGFYVKFKDGSDIQYEPCSILFNEKKKTLWINVDPDELDICFFHDRFNLGHNTDNETGAWLALTDGKLCYNKEVVSKLHTFKDEDAYNEEDHLGCRNWPNCDTEGCGEW